MKDRKSFRSTVAAVVSVSVVGAVALWQFYLFVGFRSADGAVDLQSGRHHLWWAIGFAASAFLAAFLVFSRFMRYDQSAEMHITSPPSPRTLL